jgi:hypothetical protein
VAAPRSLEIAHTKCVGRNCMECDTAGSAIFFAAHALVNVLPCQRASTCTRWPAGTLAALPAPNQLTEACQLRVRDCRVGRCDGSLQCPPRPTMQFAFLIGILPSVYSLPTSPPPPPPHTHDIAPLPTAQRWPLKCARAQWAI